MTNYLAITVISLKTIISFQIKKLLSIFIQNSTVHLLKPADRSLTMKSKVTAGKDDQDCFK